LPQHKGSLAVPPRGSGGSAQKNIQFENRKYTNEQQSSLRFDSLYFPDFRAPPQTGKMDKIFLGGAPKGVPLRMWLFRHAPRVDLDTREDSRNCFDEKCIPKQVVGQ
jgi:hypothetical protein